MDVSSGFNLSSSSTYANLSDDERRRYLVDLQARDNRLLIPTVTFLSTVAVVGLFGNSLVLMAYARKIRRNATDVFIMAIAAFDLLTNVLALPNEIYNVFHYWDFDKPSQCKLRVFVSTFATMTSAMALLAVAVTRYKKICRPFGAQTSLKTAIIMSILIAAVSGLFSVPQSILYGRNPRKTERPDILGHACDMVDEYMDTVWPKIYAGFLMFLFVAVCIPLIVLYVLIGIKAWQHSQRHGIPVIANVQSTSEYTDNTIDSEDVTNATMTSSRHGSLALSIFKINANHTSSYQSDGCGRDKILELVRKQDEETEVTQNIQSCGCQETHAINETENCSSIVTHLHLSDTENTKSTQFQRQHSPNVIAFTARNTSSDEQHNTGHANRSSELKTFVQSSKVGQSASENEVVRDHGRQENNAHQHGEAINETKSDEEIHHVSVTNFTKSDKTNGEDIRDDMTASNSTSTACRNDERFRKISFEKYIEETPEDTNRADFLAKSRKSRSKSTLLKKGQSRRVLNRTTLMLIAITLMYVIALLPYIILVALRTTLPLFYENLNPTEESVYNLFVRFPFINSAANAIIYSLCDPRFRHEIVKILKCRK